MTLKTSPLGILTFNCHMGYTLDVGAIPWLLKDIKPRVHFLLLQEVPDLASVKRMIKMYDLDFEIAPERGFPRRGLPYILYRPKRFTLKNFDAPNISFGSKHARNRTMGLFEDSRTGRDISLSNIHVDPLGKGFNNAVQGHKRPILHELQTQAYAKFLARPHEGRVLIAAGDCNEGLDEPDQRGEGAYGHRTITQRFAKAGLEPSRELLPRRSRGNRTAHLDEVFLRPDDYVKVAGRRRIEVPFKESDHDAVFANLRVTHA